MPKATARLELPYLPPVQLSPNWSPRTQGSYYVSRRVKDKLQQDTAMAAKAAGLRPMGKVLISVTFVVADHRRRDGDNWLIRLKASWDSLVKLGILKDDSSEFVSFAPVQFEVNKSQAPRTIIRIEEEP